MGELFFRVAGTLAMLFALLFGAVALFGTLRPGGGHQVRFVAEHTTRNMVRGVLDYAPESWSPRFVAWEARRDARHDLSMGIVAFFLDREEFPTREDRRRLHRRGVVINRLSASDSPIAVLVYNEVMAEAAVDAHGCRLPLPSRLLDPHCIDDRRRAPSVDLRADVGMLDLTPGRRR